MTAKHGRNTQRFHMDPYRHSIMLGAWDH